MEKVTTVFLKLNACLILNHASTKTHGKKLTDMLTVFTKKVILQAPSNKKQKQTNKQNKWICTRPEFWNKFIPSHSILNFICLQVSLTTFVSMTKSCKNMKEKQNKKNLFCYTPELYSNKSRKEFLNPKQQKLIPSTRLKHRETFFPSLFKPFIWLPW